MLRLYLAIFVIAHDHGPQQGHGFRAFGLSE
jgi:hypothetical protein